MLSSCLLRPSMVRSQWRFVSCVAMLFSVQAAGCNVLPKSVMAAGIRCVQYRLPGPCDRRNCIGAPSQRCSDNKKGCDSNGEVRPRVWHRKAA